MNDELKARKDQLRQELEETILIVQSRAKWTHRAGLWLMAIALVCSLGTGIAGLTGLLGPKALGALALLPGAAAIAATQLKLQARSNWHYRKHDALTALRSRLLYQLPVDPTADHISNIAESRDTLNRQMQAEWERAISLDWAHFKVSK